MITFLTGKCPLCKELSVLEVDEATAEAIRAWLADPWPVIQVALPMLDAGQREQLLTNIHPDCFERIAYEGEEDE